MKPAKSLPNHDVDGDAREGGPEASVRKAGRKPLPEAERINHEIGVGYRKADADCIYRVARAKGYDSVRQMLREWVLERLGMEDARLRSFGTVRIDGPDRIM